MYHYFSLVFLYPDFDCVLVIQFNLAVNYLLHSSNSNSIGLHTGHYTAIITLFGWTNNVSGRMWFTEWKNSTCSMKKTLVDLHTGLCHYFH